MSQILFNRASVGTRTTINKVNQLTRRAYHAQQNTSMKSVYNTVRTHPNTGMKVFGGAAAVTLGGYVAYACSRPANYVPSQTRELMAGFGGASFAKTVRQRIAKTYGYLTGSIIMTGATTFLLLSRGMLGRVMAINPWVFAIGTMAATMGSIYFTMSVDYFESPLLKHAAWAATNSLVGLSLLTLCGIAGGAIVQQAALITACIIGGMSTTAMVAPNDMFLQMGPYLGVGLGVVIAASFGSMFFPGSTMLMNIYLYGGLGVFGLFTAHDAQRVLHDAQVMPRFDPVSEQMGLYLDTINIFRIVVQMLLMSQRRK